MSFATYKGEDRLPRPANAAARRVGAGKALIEHIQQRAWDPALSRLTDHEATVQLRSVLASVVDPTKTASAAYNPLLEVHRSEWEVRGVRNVADVLVDPEGSLERRNYWHETSHSLLVGAILHVF